MNKNKKYTGFLTTSIPIHIIMMTTSLIPNSTIANKIRGRLLKPYFKECGKNPQIGPGVILNDIRNLIIGDNVYVAHNVWINASGGIRIGDDSIIGPYSVIATSQHAFKGNKFSNTETILEPVQIGSGCWLASHVVVTSGVSIHDTILISAGSVVTKSLEESGMYGGVPAKFIKKLIYRSL